MNKAQIGELGERIASDYLESKGFDILERNWKQYTKTGRIFGEIDIIAEKDRVIRFVEVKAVDEQKTLPADIGQGISPEQKVDCNKQRKLRSLAQIWMNKNIESVRAEFGTEEYQIDIASIMIDAGRRKAKVLYFQNAVEGD